MTDYAGIDYSHGKANVDQETGIHFGVISLQSVMPEALDDFDVDYQTYCPKCGREIKINEEDKTKCPHCEAVSNTDLCYGEDPTLSLNNDCYQILLTEDHELFVFRSKFYTRAQYCSPCFPGACNLDEPCMNGPKTYCLGHEFFIDEKAPYPIYSCRKDIKF